MSSTNPDLKTQCKINFNDILIACKERLKKSKSKTSIEEIKSQLKDSPDTADFKKAIQKSKSFPLIVEFKPASPSQGHISSRSLRDTINSFEAGGAIAISIITEESFFKGKLDYLKQASKISTLPLLRKDFILEDYQIYEARLYGASSVLLISEVYPDISSGIEICRSLDMEPLIECKNSIDVFKALDADAEIIGINNRNFKDFSIEFSRTKALSPLIPKEKILVAESGVNTLQDVQKLCKYGADALLIGTSIMKSSNIPKTISKMLLTAEETSKMISKNSNLESLRGLSNGV